MVRENPLDCRHAGRLANVPNVVLQKVAGCSHNVAAELRGCGELAEVLAAIHRP